MQKGRQLVYSFMRFGFLSALIAISSACATRVQPVGNWSRPADLQLNEKSLESVAVLVRCGLIEPDNKINEQNSRVCTVLRSCLSEIGAEAVSRNAEKIDLTLWYLSRGRSRATSSLLSTWAAYMTAWLIPAVSTDEAEAEIRVTGPDGSILDSEIMQVQVVRTFGWLTLTKYLTAKKSDSANQRDVERRFLQQVQNIVYTQARRRKLI